MEHRALVPYARVKDVQRSVAFYRKLGFTIANQHLENVPDPIWVWLTAGKANLMLHKTDEPIVPSAEIFLFAEIFLRPRAPALGF